MRAGGRPKADKPNAVIERRREDRFEKDAAVARKLERNRAMSRIFQFGAIAFAAVVSSLMLAAGVQSTLGGPIDLIEQAMAGET